MFFSLLTCNKIFSLLRPMKTWSCDLMCHIAPMLKCNKCGYDTLAIGLFINASGEEKEFSCFHSRLLLQYLVFSHFWGSRKRSLSLTASRPSRLLILDEMDQLDSKAQHVLYTLFEWPFLSNSRLCLIGKVTTTTTSRGQRSENCRFGL